MSAVKRTLGSIYNNKEKREREEVKEEFVFQKLCEREEKGKLTCSNRSNTATEPNSAAHELHTPPTARVAKQKMTASAFEGEKAPTVSPGRIPKSVRRV